MINDGANRMATIVRSLPCVGFKNTDPQVSVYGKWRIDTIKYLNPSCLGNEKDDEDSALAFIEKANSIIGNHNKYFLSRQWDEDGDMFIGIYRKMDDDCYIECVYPHSYSGDKVLQLVEYSSEFLGERVTEENYDTYIDNYSIDLFEDKQSLFNGSEDIRFEDGRFRTAVLWEISLDVSEDRYLEKNIAKLKGVFSIIGGFVVI